MAWWFGIPGAPWISIRNPHHILSNETLDYLGKSPLELGHLAFNWKCKGRVFGGHRLQSGFSTLGRTLLEKNHFNGKKPFGTRNTFANIFRGVSIAECSWRVSLFQLGRWSWTCWRQYLQKCQSWCVTQEFGTAQPSSNEQFQGPIIWDVPVCRILLRWIEITN